VGVRTSVAHLTAASGSEVAMSDTALFAASLANLKTAARLAPSEDRCRAVIEYADDVLRKVIEHFCNEAGADDRYAPLSPAIALAAELNLVANALSEGKLRSELYDLMGQVLARESGDDYSVTEAS
jgi:hypothetical protein